MIAVAATARHHRAPATLDQQIADYLAGFWPELPPQHIQMNATGPRKYAWVKSDGQFVPLTRADLVAHARGEKAIGAHLHSNGLARNGALDIDDGGLAAIGAALAAAHQLGVAAYGIYMPGAEHDGGRIVVPFDAFYPAAEIKALAQQIVAAAGLPEDTELWPGNNNGLGLPFMYHVRKQTRGELLTQAGEVFDLDVADQRAAALAAIQALPLNGAPPKVEAVSKPVRSRIDSAQPQTYVKTHNAARRQGGRLDTSEIFRQAIALFNQDNPRYISEWLGAPKSGAYFCPCGNHSSGLPKIALSFHGGIERGRSWSPDCLIFPHGEKDKYLDPFACYVIREHSGNRAAALEAVARRYGLWQEPRRRRQDPPPPDKAPDYATAAAAERRQQDAERKRDARRHQAAELLADVQARAADDQTLTEADRAVLAALVQIANGRSWCRPSKLQIAEISGYSLGAVKRALAGPDAKEPGRLEGRYFVSEGDGGSEQCTAIRTFLRGSHFTERTISDANDDPRIDISSKTLENLGACEGAPNPPRDEAEPDSLECWSWCDDAHGADDLTAALVELAPPAAAPLELQLDDAGYTFDEVAYADGRRAFLLRDALDQVICTCPTEHAVSWAIQCLELGVPLDQVLAKYASKPAAPIQTVKAGFDDSTAPELASFTPGAVFTAAPPAAVPEVIQLDPLVQAPPLESDAVRYGEFIWRWRASKPGSICKRTGKPWSQAQRDRFRAEYPAFLDDVSPAEAALRWAALDQPQPRKGARGRALTSSRAAGPPVDQQPALFSLPEVQPHDNRNPASNARPRALGANALYALG